MRKYIYFLLGLLCGAVFFSGTAVMANSGVLAKISSQIFFLNGEQTELFAYNIGGNNYIKLRDAAALFGADIEYIDETNSVHMEVPKKEEIPEDTPVVTPDIFIDGTSSSKEDFSANANEYPLIYDKNDFKEVEKVKFEDTYVNVPKNYDKILTELYGDYMEVPPEEERYNHHIDFIDFGEY